MCVNLPFGISSGCKTETESRTENHQLTERISSTMQKSSSSAGTDVKARQVLDVVVDGMVCNCVIRASQKMKGEIKVISKIGSTMQTAIQRQVEDELDNAVAKSSKQVQELLSAPVNTSSKTTVISDIKNIARNALSLETLNSICNNFSLDQEQKFHIKNNVGVGFTKDGDCPYLGKDFKPEPCFDLTQDLQFKIMASAMITAVSGAMEQSTTVQKIRQQIKEVNESESKGLNDIAATAGNTVKSVATTVGEVAQTGIKEGADVAKSMLTTYAIIAVAVIAGLCVFGFLMYKLLNGDNPVSRAASAAVSKLSSKKKKPEEVKQRGKSQTRAKSELQQHSSSALTGASGYSRLAPPPGFQL